MNDEEKSRVIKPEGDYPEIVLSNPTETAGTKQVFTDVTVRLPGDHPKLKRTHLTPLSYFYRILF